MEFEKLMSAFAEDVGLASFTPDEDGLYGCEIDDFEVYFCATEDGRLVMWSDLCDPVSNGRERLYQILLESAFLGSATAGGSFAFNPESGKIAFQRFDELELMTQERFRGKLDGFVSLLGEWRRIIDNYGESLAELERLNRGGRDSGFPGRDENFLQV